MALPGRASLGEEGSESAPMSSAPPSSPTTSVPGPSEFHCRVHFPPIDSSAIRSIWIKGWVISAEARPICRIRAVAGDKVWPGQYGIPRPDVAATFPEIKEAALSGFSIDVPILEPSFRLQLDAKYRTGGWHPFYRRNIKAKHRGKFRRFFRGAAEPTQIWHYPTLRDHLFWIDEPRDWNLLPRRFRLSGWCFSRTGEVIQAIRARVGRRQYWGNYGVLRADVAAAHDEMSGAFKSGFDIDLEAPRGRAKLALEVQHSDGLWQEVFSRKISAPLINRRRFEDRQLWRIGDYVTWIKLYDTLRLADRRKIRTQICAFSQRPLISVIMPVHNPAAHHLRKAIESVRAQLYPDWELCIADDGSTQKHVRGILARYAKLDRRIKIHFRERTGGIVAASNDALALTCGDFVALLDHDDELASTALYFVAFETNQVADLQLLYTDEDKLTLQGRRTNPHFKPDWNEELFLGQNFFCHLGVFRSALIKSFGFREGFDGSQDYDLVLRCIEKVEPHQIRHIPRILYHWRMSAGSVADVAGAKPYAKEAARRAIADHLGRRGINGHVEPCRENDEYHRVVYTLPAEPPLVSIIIPTRDRADLLERCLASIRKRADYPRIEIIVIDNGSVEKETRALFRTLERENNARILRDDQPFNFSRLNNLAANEARGEILAFLNNDIEAKEGGWLREMVSHAVQTKVGAVGARLWYPDGTLQHGGVILGLGGGGVAADAHKGFPTENQDYFARAILAQDLSAVTAACMLVKRTAFVETGGFDEQNLPVAFNDVDFCIRLAKRGFRIVYTPYAELYHGESSSRGWDDTLAKNRRFEAERKYMLDTWGDELQRDPAYNPNLSLNGAGFRLAFPPRTTKPWQSVAA